MIYDSEEPPVDVDWPGVSGRNISLSLYGCPSDPAANADAYCLGRLRSEDADRFEEHYFTCGSCAEHVRATFNLIDGLRLMYPGRTTRRGLITRLELAGGTAYVRLLRFRARHG